MAAPLQLSVAPGGLVTSLRLVLWSASSHPYLSPLRLPAQTCAECESPNIEWASVNIGVTLCGACATVHRTLGTAVRGVSCCTFTPEAVLSGAGGESVLVIMHGSPPYDHRPSHPNHAGTEHLGFSPTTQTSLAPDAKRHEVVRRVA